MDVDVELQRLSEAPTTSSDLAELALHLARDEYPNLDVEAYLGEIAAMGREAEACVRGDAAAQVQGLCRYLFHDMGFRGNSGNYYDPRNSYLNQVLDRRKGIPILLSLVTISVGRRAGLCIEGIALPGHFVTRALIGSEAILFDPFHGGRILTMEACERLVERVGGVPFEATPESLTSLPPAPFVRRMLGNLKAIYLREGDFARAARTIGRLLQLNPRDLHERRDLGISLFKAGQAGRAIDHLAAYLRASSDSPDSESVRQFLVRAQGAVARWN